MRAVHAGLAWALVCAAAPGVFAGPPAWQQDARLSQATGQIRDVQFVGGLHCASDPSRVQLVSSSITIVAAALDRAEATLRPPAGHRFVGPLRVGQGGVLAIGVVSKHGGQSSVQVWRRR